MPTFPSLKLALDAGYMVEHSVPGGYLMRRRSNGNGSQYAMVQVR